MVIYEKTRTGHKTPNQKRQEKVNEKVHPPPDLHYYVQIISLRMRSSSTSWEHN